MDRAPRPRLAGADLGRDVGARRAAGAARDADRDAALAAGFGAGRALVAAAARLGARAEALFFAPPLLALLEDVLRTPLRAALGFRLLFAAVDDFALVGIAPPRVDCENRGLYIGTRRALQAFRQGKLTGRGAAHDGSRCSATTLVKMPPRTLNSAVKRMKRGVRAATRSPKIRFVTAS
jgi:hypothetical protein